ncbi:MAG: dephospho-CoA kinase, partial [Verrucomicrobiota bacterium]
DAAWLVEIPLLFEKSLESQFDCVVCVHSPEWIVDQRMSERGYSAEDVQQRRRRQMPTSEKIDRSDYALTNAGTLEFLEKQTKRLSQQLHRQCG